VLNDVLDLSKIEAGRLDLPTVRLRHGQLAQSIRESYATQARAKGLAFGSSSRPRPLASWRGDADRLRQILGNLISNALKFTLEGAVAVRFASAEDGSGLRIDVVDTGIGIDAETLPRLFDKFVQADSSTTRRFGGSGLGLSICRELATLMDGGDQGAEPRRPGSTFTVWSPCPAGGQVDVPISTTRPPRRRSNPSRRLRVLAADDNPTNQKVIAAVLAPLNAEVVLVADGAACVEAWKRGGFDIVLMDIHMPVMDGVEAARPSARWRPATAASAPRSWRSPPTPWPTRSRATWPPAWTATWPSRSKSPSSTPPSKPPWPPPGATGSKVAAA
jgi:CheY-like chemotaxis protein